MKNHHKLRFLYVRGLTTISQLGGLGVVDKQNIILIFLFVLTQSGHLPIKTKSI
jgi:hypothetical protein